MKKALSGLFGRKTDEQVPTVVDIDAPDGAPELGGATEAEGEHIVFTNDAPLPSPPPEVPNEKDQRIPRPPPTVTRPASPCPAPSLPHSTEGPASCLSNKPSSNGDGLRVP